MDFVRRPDIIGPVVADGARAMGREVREVLGEVALDDGPAVGLERAGRLAYSVGLDVGLAIAITDIAAARMLQSYLAHEVQGDDPATLAERDRMAAAYLRVLR